MDGLVFRESPSQTATDEDEKYMTPSTKETWYYCLGFLDKRNWNEEQVFALASIDLLSFCLTKTTFMPASKNLNINTQLSND